MSDIYKHKRVVNMTTETLEALRNIAKKNDRSVNWLLKEIVQEYVAGNKQTVLIPYAIDKL